MSRLSPRLCLLGSPLFILLLVVLVAGLALAEAAAVAGQPPDLPAKTVVGVVRTNGHEPVSGALVTARRADRPARATAVTTADGSYRLTLAPGLWAITVTPTDGATPGHWIYPHEPQQVAFQPDDRPERVALDFTVVVADAAVTGLVALPDGSPPPFPVTVGLHDGEGFGRRVQADPATGAFRIAVPHGRYDVIVHPQHDGYLGPRLAPVHLRPGQTLDLGTITLVPLDAAVSGVVTDEVGRGVAGIPITAWQRDRLAAVTTRTGPGGRYRLALSPGVWRVQPSPGPDARYLYLGAGEKVRLAAGETATGVDFEVVTADATIVGLLVAAPDGGRLDLDGWATAVNRAHPRIQNGAPIRAGRFAIHIPGGGYLVSVELAPGSRYLAPAEAPVAVEPGETVTITLPLRPIDAAIVGGLVDPRQQGNPITGVRGVVSAGSDHQWTATHIQPESGTYRLGVAAGIWQLNYRIAGQEYVKIGGPANIPVQSGQTVRWPLPITRRDAGISGQVLAPGGEPVAGAVVVADGLSGDVAELKLRTRTDRQGRFRLSLPYGRYRVSATGGEPGWINPVAWQVNVPPGTVVTGIQLQFLEPNAVIQGALTVQNTSASGEVLVWAWSERGGFTSGRFPVAQTASDPDGQASGRYRLDVISGTTWHVGAVFETDDAYWTGRAVAEVTGPSTTLDLALSGPHPKPPPVVVTFDAGQAQRLTLADGTGIFIPAGAMPVTGMVTLRIIPLATLPHQPHAQVVRYGYAFLATDASGRPIEEQFHHDVLIRFRYEARDAGGPDHPPRPAYFSTTTNQWTVPERYVVDPSRLIVTMAIDHFTEFALVTGPLRPAVFMPLVIAPCRLTGPPSPAPAPCGPLPPGPAGGP